MDKARIVAWSAVGIVAVIDLVLLVDLSPRQRTTRHPPGMDATYRVANAIMDYSWAHNGSLPPLVDQRHVSPQHLRDSVRLNSEEVGKTSAGTEVVVDHWGSPYFVRKHEFGHYLLVSPGKDRLPGTGDDISWTCCWGFPRQSAPNDGGGK